MEIAYSREIRQFLAIFVQLQTLRFALTSAKGKLHLLLKVS